MLLIALVVASIVLELARLHEGSIPAGFRQFFGELIRDHEQFNLLSRLTIAIGSPLIAALLAVEIFPARRRRRLGSLTVLGDALAPRRPGLRAHARLHHEPRGLCRGAGGLPLLWAGYVVVFGGLRWEIALIGALVASLVELLPIPLDDNPA